MTDYSSQLLCNRSLDILRTGYKEIFGNAATYRITITRKDWCHQISLPIALYIRRFPNVLYREYDRGSDNPFPLDDPVN